jgi:allantoate deiminase/N-carbamoyl-L-amino-acid hydrolase
MQEKGLKSERTLEIISFADEEGWRFNKGLFGS